MIAPRAHLASSPARDAANVSDSPKRPAPDRIVDQRGDQRAKSALMRANAAATSARRPTSTA